MSRPPLGCSVCIGADELSAYWTRDQNDARWFVQKRSNAAGPYWFSGSDQYIPAVGLSAKVESDLYTQIKSYAAVNKPLAKPTGAYDKESATGESPFSTPFKAIEGVTKIEGPPAKAPEASFPWLPVGVGLVAIALFTGTLKGEVVAQVEKFVSSLSNDEWHRAIYVGWRKRRNDIPTKEAIRLLWAMWHLETGGGKGFWNYNFGNMTPGASDSHYTNGYIILNPSGISHTTGKPYPPMQFASYPTADNGAEDWIRYFSRKGWEPVMQALQAGDFDSFNHNLKVRGYYGDGDENAYLSGLKARAKLYVPSSQSFEYAAPQSGGSNSNLLFAGLGIAAVVYFMRKR